MFNSQEDQLCRYNGLVMTSCSRASAFWIFPQTLRGSFSAVSTPIFASKYSLESSWRDLQDVHTFAPLRSQNFSQISSTFFREWILNFRFFHFLHRILHFFWEFLMKFCPGFATNSREGWRVSVFKSNLWKQIRKLPKILKSVKIIQYYLILVLFIRVLSSELQAFPAAYQRSSQPAEKSAEVSPDELKRLQAVFPCFHHPRSFDAAF